MDFKKLLCIFVPKYKFSGQNRMKDDMFSLLLEDTKDMKNSLIFDTKTNILFCMRGKQVVFSIDTNGFCTDWKLLKPIIISDKFTKKQVSYIKNWIKQARKT